MAAFDPNAPAADLGGIHVLVVDDDASVRDAATMVLEQFGARVTSVPSASEALAALQRDRPHVLLSDLGMPGTDGYDLIRTVRALPPEKGRAIPAAAVSAYGNELDRRRALRRGFDLYIPKPTCAIDLVRAVRVLAGCRRLPAAS